jgi:hypothetical protein
MGRKKSAETEKVAAGQVERESHVDDFLLHRESGENNELLVLSRNAEMSGEQDLSYG